MRERGGCWGAPWENEVAGMVQQRDEDDALRENDTDPATRERLLWEAVEQFTQGLMEIPMHGR
jgi:hypothetical protein